MEQPRKPRILINASTLVKGGALQVAVSLIQELVLNKDLARYWFVCSKSVSEELAKIFGELPAQLIVLKSSPARLRNRRIIKKQLDNIVELNNINVVFTVFGPSYWTPQVPHLSGFADGWCYNPQSIAFSKLGLLSRIKRRLLSRYKLYYLKRNSDYIVIETVDGKRRLASVLNIADKNIYVVGNSYNRLIFENERYLNRPSLIQRKAETIYVLTVSAYYPHKNLEIIKRVADLLPINSNIVFILTIPDEIFKLKFQHEKIINLGPIKVSDCPRAYFDADIVLMPSLLETFSANYPESMVMQKPIITTDLTFAHEVCGNAALYYEADNPKALLEKLIQLSESSDLREELVKRGNNQLKKFITSDSRANSYIKILSEIAEP